MITAMTTTTKMTMTILALSQTLLLSRQSTAQYETEPSSQRRLLPIQSSLTPSQTNPLFPRPCRSTRPSIHPSSGILSGRNKSYMCQACSSKMLSSSLSCCSDSIQRTSRDAEKCNAVAMVKGVVGASWYRSSAVYVVERRGVAIELCAVVRMREKKKKRPDR
jgi:hypothetical protein